MDRLRDFLLARLLEEEALAQAAIDAHPGGHTWTDDGEPDSAHFARWNPWRVLSTCVAKRLIIAAHRDVGPGMDRRAEPDRSLKPRACSTCGQYDEFAIEWPCYTMRVLALDWVDHPGYRTEWRPQRLSSGVGRAPAASSVVPAQATAAVRAPTAESAEARPPVPEQAPGQPAA
jgi:uncharacterized protein DUF6221